jgi:hypothetical protein
MSALGPEAEASCFLPGKSGAHRIGKGNDRRYCMSAVMRIEQHDLALRDLPVIRQEAVPETASFEVRQSRFCASRLL